jgi:hypothetical protein
MCDFKGAIPGPTGNCTNGKERCILKGERIDLMDWAELVGHMGMVGFRSDGAPAPGGWNPLADLEPDGLVNERDFAAFRNACQERD